MNSYSAYLFDMDGTLVDSERLKGKALVKTCQLFGGLVDVDTYKAVMGESWENVTRRFFERAGINPDRDKFNSEFKTIYQELLYHELEPKANVVEFLSNLKNSQKKLGLVSSASFWMVDLILSLLALEHFFDVVITREQVTNLKPDPEAYLLALKKLVLPASEVLIFEDSESGIIAARRANCDSVAFRHGFNESHDFRLANRVVSNFRECLEMV